eukprot:TRINITY_DN4333_c0_g1_i3.p1 TRINITY_DN4333_c0_g1~~TRINITY_DN4333_c0_g1_i3.p1  ORF type:complete len:936 (-),score=259.34 TRINITY_DN4333_c0_g1_i3:148-2862(-)
MVSALALGCWRRDGPQARAVVASILAAVLLCGPLPARGNWLLQCSSCVDQAYFGDTTVKENVKDADLNILLAQVKEVRLREYDHREDEFYNKFFSKRQLGVIAQEMQSIMPSAVALLPERRWTNAKGMSNVTKNVMMLRDSQLNFAAFGALQLLARRADRWDATIDKLEKEMTEVLQEQNDNRRKREEMLEQMVRIIAKVEVMQHSLTKTEQGFVKLGVDISQFKKKQDEAQRALSADILALKNASAAQDVRIETFFADFRAAVEREARADLVEKRKAAEAEVEVQLVKRSIEKLRWEEEQKTIQMREDEKRKSEDHSSKLHQERVAHELAQKKAADLDLMKSQEESNMRQEEARVQGERALLLLKLESEEKRAEIDVKKGIEQAKVEAEAKIREKRENEDVHTRMLKAEQDEKRRQILDGIQATADIVKNWIAHVYGSPKNLAIAIGSIVIAIAGAFLAREMAILLREQLNKRLGRPSLVRSTNRRGTLQESWNWVLRFLRLKAPRGSEFSDVVLHPRLQAQVMRLADATRSAKRRRMPLQHIMFYGPPGTGKTMVAQRFAEYSGLEYAIMSGGDVAPLQEQGVTELHKLFKWVHRSRRGVLLFIDEADAFLASRKGGNMSESLRNSLTTMLYHTGTPTSQFMMVLATNRPCDLDSAVLDRVDESVEFGLPDVDARLEMVRLYFKMFIAKPLNMRILGKDENPNEQKRKGIFGLRSGQNGAKPNGVPLTPGGLRREDLVDDGALGDVAKRINGFSGREISKLFMSLQTHILYASARAEVKGFLRRSLLMEVIDSKVLEHERTVDFNTTGAYEYVHVEGKGTPIIGTPIITPNGTFSVPKMMRREASGGNPAQAPPLPGAALLPPAGPAAMPPPMPLLEGSASAETSPVKPSQDPERTAGFEPA